MTKSFSQQIYPKRLEKLLGEWKTYGAVSTPEEIVDLMIKVTGFKRWKGLNILEPACGFCNFLFGIYSKFPKNKFSGIEINNVVYQKIKEIFKNIPFELEKTDFLLWDSKKKFDLVIGNPPYGIIGDETHYPIHVLKQKKEEYKRLFNTWFGKYNIYGAFIEKGVNLLKKDGKLVFIIPATWIILDEFSKLRKFLSFQGKTKVYYLGRGVFQGVNVSTCILVFEKSQKGVELYYKDNSNFIKCVDLDEWDGRILQFETDLTKKLKKNKTLLGEIFDIRISARSPEVRSFGKVLSKPISNALPFLNGRNIKRGLIDRENYTDLWLEKNEAIKLKSFYGRRPRIVVGHTKGGKIFAAIEDKIYPYVGDVYHLLPKVGLTKIEMKKIVDWLNSQEIEKYTTTLYKEITPHITATQLKEIPLNIKVNKGTLFDL